MRYICLVVLTMALAGLLLGIVSCSALALSGAKKYKVELSNVLLKVKDEIQSEGEVGDRTVTKLENLLAKYNEEFGEMGSHIRATEAFAEIKQAKATPADAFMHYQAAEVKIADVMDMLKTEVD